MLIQQTQIAEYRNIEYLQAQFVDSINIFIGNNGQGKSNLLEAIYLSCQGESFRFCDNHDLIQKSKSNAVIQTRLFHKNLDYDIHISILKSRKVLEINQKKNSLSELKLRFPTLIFSPESLSAIKEGADYRRQLIDDMLVLHSPIKANLIAEFRKALKTRNRILKLFIDDPLSKSNLLLLESMDETYLRLATDLTVARVEALHELKNDFKGAMTAINEDAVDISVDYVISGLKVAKDTLFQVHDLMRNRMIELRQAEISNGASLVGPHKHDIRFLYHGNDSRTFCSQGQQRALILAFKMAQIVYHRRVHGTYPVLMLDDVLSELDNQKRESLLRFLISIKTQIFITTTDLEAIHSFQKGQCAVFKISRGQIVERSLL